MRLAVVLTVYERLEHFHNQLTQLAEQSNKNFDLYICNNSETEIETPLGQTFHYVNKYKMYGRFFLIRDHILPKNYDAILILDDDEILPKNLIDQCHKQFNPTMVKSFWAFETSVDYWFRRRLKGQAEGDYAGTGGHLSPIDLWCIPEVYEAPPQYWIIDDLWLSYCILKHTNYRIRNLEVGIKFVDDEGSNATYKKIRNLKSEFHKEHIIPHRPKKQSYSPTRQAAHRKAQRPR